MTCRISASASSPYVAFGISLCFHLLLLVALLPTGHHQLPVVLKGSVKNGLEAEANALTHRASAASMSRTESDASLSTPLTPQRARAVDSKQIEARQLEISQKIAKRKQAEVEAQLKLSKLNQAIMAKQTSLSALDEQKKAADQAYQKLQAAQAAEKKKLKDLAAKNAALEATLQEQTAEQSFVSKLNSLSASATSSKASFESMHASRVKQAIEAHLIKAPSMRGKRCKIEIKLDKTGKILSTKVLSGDPSLIKAALRAIQLTETIPLTFASETEFKRIETTKIQFEG